MPDSRLLKEVSQYKPIGQRNIGRPRKYWRSVYIPLGPEQMICLVHDRTRSEEERVANEQQEMG